MKRYPVIIERGEANFSAYLPDVPGCVATGATVEETLRELRAALETHCEGMAEDGDPVPEPSREALEEAMREMTGSDLLAFIEVGEPVHA